MGKQLEHSAKVLLIDIETSPNIAAVWGMWKQNIGLDMINTDWSILSYCAKWLGEDDIIYEDISEKKVGNYEDDFSLLENIHKLLDEADFVVGHNAERFDVKKINARLIMNGFSVPSPYKVIDTLSMAKKSFAFTSNKLAYLTDKLCKNKKTSHAKFAGYELWKECLKGNPEAWAEMKEYNIMDVVSLEELYEVLAPWYPHHPVLSHFTKEEQETPICPRCGSHHLIKRGHRYTNAGKYQRYVCASCGGWSQDRYSVVGKKENVNRPKSC